MSLIYPCANTRKCYWLYRECLKGHKECARECSDYLSMAVVKRLSKRQMLMVWKYTGHVKPGTK